MGVDPTDEDLFAAYAAGDVRAFETLFRRYQGPLGRHLARILDGDHAAAEDLVVETFLRLHRHRHHFRQGTSLRPWIYTIARNLARNRRRGERLWALVPLAALDRSEATEAHTHRDELERRVTAAFATLPSAQREACSLRLLAELTLEEIAQVTGVSVGTVKSRVFYGLRKLRVLLADFAPGAG